MHWFKVDWMPSHLKDAGYEEKLKRFANHPMAVEPHISGNAEADKLAEEGRLLALDGWLWVFRRKYALAADSANPASELAGRWGKKIDSSRIALQDILAPIFLPTVLQANTAVITCPCTSVRRRSKPVW